MLEALASGVPAIVTPDGGPRPSSAMEAPAESSRTPNLPAAVAGILADPAKHAEMRIAARAHALTMSWDSVFEGVYAAYEAILPQAGQAVE